MVRSGVSVIEEKGGWSCNVIANSGIVQLFFERKVSYGRIAKVLAAEGLKVPKKTIWITISKYKAHGTLSHLPGSGRRFKLAFFSLWILESNSWNSLLSYLADPLSTYLTDDSIAHGLWGSSVFID